MEGNKENLKRNELKKSNIKQKYAQNSRLNCSL